jgi:hypothetical protein
MNDHYQFINEAHYRYEKYLQEADHERLVRLALKNRSNSKPARVRFLLWLGNRLTGWGARLVERYQTDRVNPGSMFSDSIQSANGC